MPYPLSIVHACASGHWRAVHDYSLDRFARLDDPLSAYEHPDIP